MQVRAVFHRTAEPWLIAWRHRLSQQPGGDPALALFMREELLQKLEETEGFPEGAVYRNDLVPPGWVWRFAPGAWIHFAVRDVGGFWGIGKRREVVVFRITPDNPA